MSKRYYVLILLGLGLLTRFMFFGHPNETVFDEVHFGKFISGYYTREYFFDIHPPLGKLAIAGFAKVFHFKPEFAFAEIGDAYPDKQYLVLRFLPALAGALLPLVIYLLALEMGFRRQYAFTGGLLIALDNALLTQSHYILLDSFLLLFGFLALLFYFKSGKPWAPWHNKWYKPWCPWFLFGLFSGLAISIKWTGLAFLALPLAFELFSNLKEKQYKNIPKLAIPVVIAGVLYFAFFAIHLTVLNRSGPGDAFMSQGFRKTLAGNKVSPTETMPPSNIFQKFTELNTEMYKANQNLKAEHPYSSVWYTWPFMSRPIYYWVHDNARIYLIGNPVIWWLATAAILYALLNIILNGLRTLKDKTMIFLLGGYVLNLLPFIGVKRVMFLYHYFVALIFSILILAYILDKSFDKAQDKQSLDKLGTGKSSKWVIGTLLVLSAAAFIFFAPLSYGLNLSPGAYEARVWFDSWR